MVGYQLHDSRSLHGKWLFHQTSTLNWLFGVAGMNVHPMMIILMDSTARMWPGNMFLAVANDLGKL